MQDVEGGLVMELDGEKVEVTKDLVDMRIEGEEGYEVGVDGGVAVAISTELTPELIDEGLAREIVSKVQQIRKQQDLEMMDNIKVTLKADDEVTAAVEKHKDYIMTETLATELNMGEAADEYKINGHATGINVEKL